jgi:hypothetical protein
MSRTTALLSLVAGLMLCTNAGYPQGVYMTLNAGYSLGIATQSFGANATFLGPAQSYEGIYGSLGEGGKFGASVGTMFTPNLGAEFCFSYWLGRSFEITNLSPGDTSTSKWSATGFVAIPSIVFSTDLKPVSPYARLGLIVGVLRPEQEITIAYPIEKTEVTMKESGGVALGCAGAVGIAIPIGGPVDLCTEVVAHAVSYSPGQSEITRYVVNGVDQLSTLSHKTFDYKESYTPSDAATRLAVRRAFSSIGALVGVRIRL